MQREEPTLIEPGDLTPQSLDHFVWTWLVSTGVSPADLSARGRR
jgi:hypothetical protein